MRFDMLLDEFTSVYCPFSQTPRRPARNGGEDFEWDQPAVRQPRPSRGPLLAACCAVVVLAGLSAGVGFIGW
jgi:hypothetical protein